MKTRIHKAMAIRQWLAHIEHSDTAAAVRSDARCSGTTRGPLQFLEAGEARVICRGGKIWVPEAMVPEILTMYHDDRGYFEVKRTVQMIQEKFWILKITEVVSEYIRRCDTC